MKDLLEAMNSLKMERSFNTNGRELTDDEKNFIRDEIFGIVCNLRRNDEMGQSSKEEVEEYLTELVNNAYGEEGLFMDDALFEQFPELEKEAEDPEHINIENKILEYATELCNEIRDDLDSYIEDADKANEVANESKDLKESYSEKDLQPGSKFYGPAGAMIQIVEPRKDGKPQWQMTNTNNGKVGKVNTSVSYGQLAQILKDNHYVKLGEEKENLQEDITNVTGENIADTFKNYKAFLNNFGPITIIKRESNFYVYKQDAADDNDYKYYTDSRDNIEGWLYGAVQVANGIFKSK